MNKEEKQARLLKAGLGFIISGLIMTALAFIALDIVPIWASLLIGLSGTSIVIHGIETIRSRKEQRSDYLP